MEGCATGSPSGWNTKLRDITASLVRAFSEELHLLALASVSAKKDGQTMSHDRNSLVDRAAKGAYTPRGFTIELRHPDFEPPKDGKLVFTKELFPTFMHEFSHLVQDRGTFRGVMNFLDLWDQISTVSNHCRLHGAEVPRPIIQINGRQHRLPLDQIWARELDRLRAKSEPRIDWTDDDRFWAFQQHRIHIHKETLAGREIEFPYVYLDFIENVTGEPYSHPVGAWEIREAYAVAVGLLHGGKLKQPGLAGFEYLAIERLLAYHFGEVFPRQTIALCHWALQDLSPSLCLLRLVEKCKEAGWHKLPAAEELYELGRKDALAFDFERNIREITNSTLPGLEQGHAAHGNEVVARLFRWFREHAEVLLLTHLDSRRQFPLDTFLCQDSQRLSAPERDNALNQLLFEVQVPLIIYPDGSHYAINATADDVDVVYVNRCALTLFNWVWKSNTAQLRCPIHPSCKAEVKDDTDCLGSPWVKSKLPKTCAFAAATKILGLRPEQDFKHEPFAAAAADTGKTS